MKCFDSSFCKEITFKITMQRSPCLVSKHYNAQFSFLKLIARMISFSRTKIFKYSMNIRLDKKKSQDYSSLRSSLQFVILYCRYMCIGLFCKLLWRVTSVGGPPVLFVNIIIFDKIRFQESMFKRQASHQHRNICNFSYKNVYFRTQ